MNLVYNILGITALILFIIFIITACVFMIICIVDIIKDNKAMRRYFDDHK